LYVDQGTAPDTVIVSLIAPICISTFTVGKRRRSSMPSRLMVLKPARLNVTGAQAEHRGFDASSSVTTVCTFSISAGLVASTVAR
jgi:hypothetical protein